MSKYLAVFRIRFTNGLQYRTAALAGMTTQFVWGFMEILAFRAFWQANPGAFPMAFSETVSYIWLQQAFLALYMMWFFEGEIFDAITQGGIAYELARPFDLYWRWFTQSAANRLAKMVLRCLPILVVAFLLPKPLKLTLPTSGMSLLLFLCSSFLALGVVVAFSMLVYISTFYTLSPSGVRIISAVFADFLAGAVIPLPFFPENFRIIAELSPFGSMQNMPLRIYSGNIAGNGALRGIGLQFFWLVILVGIGKFTMKRALKKVVVQGG